MPNVDDGNPCTVDACDPVTGTTHTPLAAGTSCDDANRCTQQDECNAAGQCVGATVNVDDANPCTDDSCSPIDGVHHAPRAVGASCSDGDPCNGDEQCATGGVCDGGAPPAIDDGNPCTQDSCDAAHGVLHVALPTGSSCGDGNVCNGDESCDGQGACLPGAPLNVDDQEPCTLDSCDIATGVHHVPAQAGTPCSNGNSCDGEETCDGAGACLAGVAPVVDDGNPCTADSYDAATGVQHQPVAAGTSCSDGNACNGQESCDGAGACVPSNVSIDDGNPCTIDACDPVTGVSHLPAAQGASCSDGNECNGVETCDGAGACMPATVVLLSDGDPCTIDACDASSGTITHTQAPAGASCSNGDVCDGEETCDAAGACSPGVPLVVDDGDPATLDACDPVLGVRHTMVPVLDNSTATLVYSSTSFLYSGPEAIQAGVAPGTIEPVRAGVLRGKATQRDGTPLPGVRMSVLGHPELGTTATRLDGTFDMVVNAGGALTLTYEKPEWLAVQRTVDSRWQDYRVVDDVVMIAKDSAVTTVALDGMSDTQVARGTPTLDEDGPRQATLIFQQGTAASLRMPDGTVVPIDTVSVRATEYTVGASGPKAMPGQLPPTSGYTYAVDLSVDEAQWHGAERVEFDKPVYFYVDNFVGFPVGIDVPTGYYDEKRGAWVASESGRIIEVVGVTAGLADVDADGDGFSDDTTALAALGMTDAEREKLAALYEPGTSLWRVPITHFSPWDCNWPFGPPDDADGPGDDTGEPEGDDQGQGDQQCPEEGHSTVECQAQVLREQVSVVGTPYTLNYSSRRNSSVLHIPLSAGTLPASIAGIALDVWVAGRTTHVELRGATAELLNRRYEFAWDGRDAYGRTVQGRQPVVVDVGYIYPAGYQQSSRFGYSGNGISITGDRAKAEVTLWRHWKGLIGRWDAVELGLGGWTMSEQHAYSPVSRTLYMGDGTQRTADGVGPIIDAFAGKTHTGPGFRYYIDGHDAREAMFGPMGDVAFGPDGSAFIVENADAYGGASSAWIWRVDREGIIHLVLIQPSFSGISALTVCDDNSVYFGDDSGTGWRLWRLRPDGTVGIFAGSGDLCDAGPPGCGDFGPASVAAIGMPKALACGRDGSLMVAAGYRIRRIEADGTIVPVAGNGLHGYSPDGTAALDAAMDEEGHIAIDQEGRVLFAQRIYNRVRRVEFDGTLATIAGNGSGGGDWGDGGQATAARLWRPDGLAVGQDGTIYIGEPYDLRAVAPNGMIARLAGLGKNCYCYYGGCGDGGPALAARFDSLGGQIAISPGGAVVVGDHQAGRFRVVAPGLPGISLTDIPIASEDGSRAFLFDASGRHLRTLEALTGTTLLSFGYDADHRLVSITDANDQTTTLTYSAGGNPTSIVAPFGQQTALEVSSDGLLSAIQDPLGNPATMQYAPGGLLTLFTDLRGEPHTYGYDPVGRLETATDAAGAATGFSRVLSSADSYAVQKTTALGRTTTFRVDDLWSGKVHTNTFPAGQVSTSTSRDDGTTTATLPDGTVVTTTATPDPRFGMMSPLQSTTTRLPSGLTMTEQVSRAVTLTDVSNPLSVATMTDSVTVNGRTSTTSYVASTRTRTTTSPGGRVSRTVLDSQGRPVHIELPAVLASDVTFDGHGRLSQRTQGTRAQSFAYDPTSGYLQSVTDALSNTTLFERDALGRATLQTFADTTAIGFGFDAASNLTSLTPPGKPAHGFSYTPVDLVSQYAPPAVNGSAANVTQYAYDLDRALTVTTRPDGLTEQRTYDTAGRLSTITLPTGVITYAYDPTTGALASVTGPYGETLAYTRNGRLTTALTWTGPVAGTVSWTYNTDFRQVSEKVNAANEATFAYDPDGLMTTAGAQTRALDAASGMLGGTTLGNVTDSRTYNEYGEPASYTASYSGAPLLAVAYERDALGRIVTKTEMVEGATHVLEYSYDLRGRLTDVLRDATLVEHYEYDANGNRTSFSNGSSSVFGTYDDQDRLLAYGTKSYEYTANGELESKHDSAGTTAYEYDVRGALRRVELPSGSVVDYIVDGTGRRVGKKVDGALVQGLLYRSALQPVAELDGSGNVVGRFVYGTGVNVPEYVVRGTDTYRVITDHLGSVRMVVNVATGKVVQRMEYDSFGVVTRDEVTAGFRRVPFGFAGGLYDPETGLVRFGARDYDAEVGRWTGKDPIDFDGQDSNLFGYVGGDPVNRIDFVGLGPYELGQCLLGGGSWSDCWNEEKDRFGRGPLFPGACGPYRNPPPKDRNEKWAECEEKCEPYVTK